jgi:hypothetical protein
MDTTKEVQDEKENQEGKADYQARTVTGADWFKEWVYDTACL